MSVFEDFVNDELPRRVGLGAAASPSANNYLRATGVGKVVEQRTPAQVVRDAVAVKGADITSATALALGTDGNYFDVTGTTTITSINTSGRIGTWIKLHFDGIITLTHHATNLILPGAANITTAAGDEAEFVEYTTGDYRCTNYQVAADAPGGGGLQNVLEDTTPELGGELDCGAHTIGFTIQTATGDGTTTIDWKLGNKFFFTFGAQNEAITFTDPSNPCALTLYVKQDSTGSRIFTDTGWTNILWPGGTPAVLSTAANAIDILTLEFDGTDWYCTEAKAFS